MNIYRAAGFKHLLNSIEINCVDVKYHRPGSYVYASFYPDISPAYVQSVAVSESGVDAASYHLKYEDGSGHIVETAPPPHWVQRKRQKFT